jgi:hypothetical protein
LKGEKAREALAKVRPAIMRAGWECGIRRLELIRDVRFCRRR